MARQTKDYSHLIGKKFGNRTILDIVQKKQYGPWAQTYAICKCKCGRIDEVKLDNLNSGQSLGCYVCGNAIQNKSTGIRNISYDQSKDRFVVSMERNSQRVKKCARTLDEAILIKELLLKHFDEYGCFNIEKLNDSYYTRKRHNINITHGKDYSYLIGQTLNGWEIVSIDDLATNQYGRRKVRLRNNVGDIKERRLDYVVRALKQSPKGPTKVRSNTGVENISYNKRLNYYRVSVMRDGAVKQRGAKTLEEAIEIKEQFLKEFENEMNTHD
jgi:hypothetical protein